MREIKFRAWYSDEMIYSIDFTQDRDGTFHIYVGQDNVGMVANLMEGCEITTAPSTRLMQHTGLRDKNGKEIYEGDVVVDEYTYNRVGAEDIKNYPALHRIVKREQVPSDEYYDTSGFVGFNLTPEQVYVVIGNIYENPELLDKARGL